MTKIEIVPGKTWDLMSNFEGKSLSQRKRLAIQRDDLVKPNKLFVYGILKCGFSLDLRREGARFLGDATLQNANLYRIGQGVGLWLEGRNKVYGEVFEIPQGLWRWLDRIENHPYTYRREVVQLTEHVPLPFDDRGETRDAWVYIHQHPEYFSDLIENGKYEVNGKYARG